jgi:hypothetical protein
MTHTTYKKTVEVPVPPLAMLNNQRGMDHLVQTIPYAERRGSVSYRLLGVKGSGADRVATVELTMSKR